ncbi:MAG: hypothetical protein AUJ49_06505 [Desulfovibrionaceae bacterium CG1_02_65_16]|nr:MAG: hypothetical protein AUJ49_06505 [Desulfovibrionaceae bacterium CG1_02_65_16]
MRIALLLALVCGVLACAAENVGQLLALDRAGALHGQIWRLWTGHLVHYSAQHAALDITALFVLAAIAEREMGARATGALLLLGAPVISLCLLLAAPGMLLYKGSSALSAMLGVAGGAWIWRRAPRLRAALMVVGGVALVKTLCDALGYLPGFSSVPGGVRVAWQAHAIGAAFALAWVMLVKPPAAPHAAHP